LGNYKLENGKGEEIRKKKVRNNKNRCGKKTGQSLFHIIHHQSPVTSKGLRQPQALSIHWARDQVDLLTPLSASHVNKFADLLVIKCV
jgi:hypothetical protein